MIVNSEVCSVNRHRLKKRFEKNGDKSNGPSSEPPEIKEFKNSE
jgi:hypothetical protein